MAGAEKALATIFVFGRDSASIAVREQNIGTGERCTRAIGKAAGGLSGVKERSVPGSQVRQR